jgi:MraZ protein
MLTRKTQYAWMGLGGMICLFGLVLACKLRDGNKASAQPEPLPPPAMIGKPTVAPVKTESAWRTGLKVESKTESAPKLKTSVPMATLEMPMPVPSGPKAKLPPAPMQQKPMPPDPAPLLPASFAPNAPTPVETKSTPLPAPLPAPPPPALPPPSSKPAITSTTKPIDPPAKSTSDPMVRETAPKWNAPGTVVPISAAPANEHESARSQPGEPPLAPAPGPVQLYHVHSAETLQDIARRTLSIDRWNDVHKLNPTLRPDEKLHPGTTVRLPADACVQADDVEPVKPLPTLRAKPPTPKAKVLPLTGTYQCSLDEKGQLTLPRAIRDQLNGSNTVLLSPGPDKCLWLTNHPHLERLGERLEQSQANEADVRVFKRLYFAQTEKLSVNSDGRVTIPERLGQFAGLRQEVVLVGVDDHFEVWDAGRWRSYTQQKSAGHSPTLAEQE